MYANLKNHIQKSSLLMFPFPHQTDDVIIDYNEELTPITTPVSEEHQKKAPMKGSLGLDPASADHLREQGKRNLQTASESKVSTALTNEKVSESRPTGVPTADQHSRVMGGAGASSPVFEFERPRYSEPMGSDRVMPKITSTPCPSPEFPKFPESMGESKGVPGPAGSDVWWPSTVEFPHTFVSKEGSKGVPGPDGSTITPRPQTLGLRGTVGETRSQYPAPAYLPPVVQEYPLSRSGVLPTDPIELGQEQLLSSWRNEEISKETRELTKQAKRIAVRTAIVATTLTVGLYVYDQFKDKESKSKPTEGSDPGTDA